MIASLESISALITTQVSAWEGVMVESRAGGDFVEFKVGRRQIGHLHGTHLADLPFPVRVRKELVASGRAQLHYLHPDTGWVSYYIKNADDVPRVVALFRLNYERPWKLEDSGAASRGDVTPAYR